jgi:hypothetical protein
VKYRVFYYFYTIFYIFYSTYMIFLLPLSSNIISSSPLLQHHPPHPPHPDTPPPTPPRLHTPPPPPPTAATVARPRRLQPSTSHAATSGCHRGALAQPWPKPPAYAAGQRRLRRRALSPRQLPPPPDRPLPPPALTPWPAVTAARGNPRT